MQSQVSLGTAAKWYKPAAALVLALAIGTEAGACTGSVAADSLSASISCSVEASAITISQGTFVPAGGAIGFPAWRHNTGVNGFAGDFKFDGSSDPNDISGVVGAGSDSSITIEDLATNTVLTVGDGTKAASDLSGTLSIQTANAYDLVIDSTAAASDATYDISSEGILVNGALLIVTAHAPQSIAVFTGKGSDRVSVHGPPSPLNIKVNSRPLASSRYSVTIDQLASMTGDFFVSNVAVAPLSLTVDDSGRSSVAVYSGADGLLKGMAPAQIAWTPNALQSVSLKFGLDELLNVASSGVESLDLEGNGVGDYQAYIQIGADQTTPHTFSGPINVHSVSGSVLLEIYRNTDFPDEVVNVYNDAVYGMTNKPITRDPSVQTVDLLCGTSCPGNVVVNGVAAQTHLGINGAANVTIGDGDTSKVLGGVGVVGTAHTALTIDGSAEIEAHNAVLTSTYFIGMSSVGWGESSLSSLRILFGSGDDTIDVQSSVPNITNRIELGDGDNVATVVGSGLGTGSVNVLIAGTGDDVFKISAVPADVGELSIFGGAQNDGDTLEYSGAPVRYANVSNGAILSTGTIIPLDGSLPIEYNSIEFPDRIFFDGYGK